MTLCTTKKIEFARRKGRKIEAEFSGGDITSDAGILLLRMAEKKLGLIKEIFKVIDDPRDKEKYKHEQVTMLRQRIFGVALGYEDLNDHITLRKDKAFQAAVEKKTDLASSSTLCRLENRIKPKELWRISEVLVDVFIKSHKNRPKSWSWILTRPMILFMEVSWALFFMGIMISTVFCRYMYFAGSSFWRRTYAPETAMRPSTPGEILSLLVKKFCGQWPEAKIIFRGDSGFCKHKIMNWCEKTTSILLSASAKIVVYWKHPNR